MKVELEDARRSHLSLADVQAELRAGLEGVRTALVELSSRLDGQQRVYLDGLPEIPMAARYSSEPVRPLRRMSPSQQQKHQLQQQQQQDNQGEMQQALRATTEEEMSRLTRGQSLFAHADALPGASEGAVARSTHSASINRLDWRIESGVMEKELKPMRRGNNLQKLDRLGKQRFKQLRSRTRCFLSRHGMWLDIGVASMIVINSICIGVEIQNGIDGVESTMLKCLETFFLGVFLVEMCLRVLGDDGRYVWSGWFLFDAILIITGVCVAWFLAPALSALGKGTQDFTVFNHFTVLRIFRIMRLAWMLRLFEFFEEVSLLCNGLLKSGKTVMTTCTLVFMMTYLFACMGVEAIQGSSSLRENPMTNQIVQDRFSSVLRTMLTLWSWTTGDSLAAIYEPIISQSPLFAFFFASVWLIVTISLMNLVTAVIVDCAIVQSRKNEEKKQLEVRKIALRLVPTIGELFDRLDMDQTGYLERHEVSLDGVKLDPELKRLIAGDEDKLADLFSFLDIDRSGTICKKEFTDGVMHLVLQNVPIETTQTITMLRELRLDMADMCRELASARYDLEHLWCGLEDLRVHSKLANLPPNEIAAEGVCACPSSRRTA